MTDEEIDKIFKDLPLTFGECCKLTIEHHLSSSPDGVLVSFIKKSDGSFRRMKCTTNFNLIPPEFHPISKSQVKRIDIQEGDIIKRVFDIEANGWRSFDWKSVINYELPFKE